MDKTYHRGNVLFFILIAVALFAALSYAVTNSFRGGETTITQEQARIGAGEILRAMGSVKDGYNYLVNQGCSIDDIGFDNPASTNVNCQIFHPEGAGVSYPNNLADYQTDPAAPQTGKFVPITTTTHASGAYAGDYKVIGAGTSAQDISLELNYVSNEICLAVNKLLKYNFDGIPQDTGQPIGDTNTNLVGKTKACRKDSVNQIYFVLFEM